MPTYFFATGLGPAALTSGGASNCSKFLAKRWESSAAVLSYSGRSTQEFRGFNSSEGTPGQDFGIREPERRLNFELHIGKIAFHQRIHHGARMRQAHALAYAVASALPAGIHQPALRIVLAQAAAQHLRVSLGRQRHERRAKAG